MSLIRYTSKPQIVTITDGFAAIDVVIRGGLTLAEDAYFLKLLGTGDNPENVEKLDNSKIWVAALMALIVMRQDLMQQLTGLPADPIPLDAKPEDVLGDIDALSVQFASTALDLFIAEKQSKPMDERPKNLQGSPWNGSKSSMISSELSPQTPASKPGKTSRAA